MTNATPQTNATKEILSALRSAVLFEQQERVDAPIEARRMAEDRIARANAEKLRLVKAAYESGSTKVAIAEQLGIQNLGRVTKLIHEAEGRPIE